MTDVNPDVTADLIRASSLAVGRIHHLEQQVTELERALSETQVVAKTRANEIETLRDMLVDTREELDMANARCADLEAGKP